MIVEHAVKVGNKEMCNQKYLIRPIFYTYMWGVFEQPALVCSGFAVLFVYHMTSP